MIRFIDIIGGEGAWVILSLNPILMHFREGDKRDHGLQKMTKKTTKMQRQKDRKTERRKDGKTERRKDGKTERWRDG